MNASSSTLRSFLTAAALLLFHCLPGLAQAQSQTNRYRILFGDYVVEGDVLGVMTNALPTSSQAWIEVTTGLPGTTAVARILGSDGTNVALSLANGTLVGSSYRFHFVTNAPNYPLNPNPAQVDYTLSLGSGTLSLTGFTRTEPYGADIPYAFSHYGVYAVALPDLFTLLRPPGNFGVSTKQLYPGDVLGVNWHGYNYSIFCPSNPPPCVERFGSAYGPWQDAVFLVRGATCRLLGTALYSSWLPPGAGYTQQANFVVPPDLPPGVYGIEVRIDYHASAPNGLIEEQDERNNAVLLPDYLTVLPRLAIGRIQRLDDSTVRLQLIGAPTQPGRVQATLTLPGGPWADVATVPVFQGAYTCDDTTATNAVRFYRAVSP